MRHKKIIITLILLVFLATIFLVISLKRKYPSYPLLYDNIIFDCAAKYNLDVYLLYGLIRAESSFDKDALSNKGAVGLMQLMPDTARFIAEINSVDYDQDALYDPEYNINLGCMYLVYLYDSFKTTEHTLMAYNAGEGRVKKWLDEGNTDIKTFPYEETRNYINRINYHIEMYKTMYYLY